MASYFIRYVGMAVGTIIGSLLYQDGRLVLTFGVRAIGIREKQFLQWRRLKISTITSEIRINEREGLIF
ncbi:hypothetical protein [Brevibacillus laterosporus]|uniref:hypothetical protein n=1 Tax=Brevibacillus laterosporus TaxID=1465 RepID=UPI001F09A654|nr:hypothetical protein [Brevibacillus laterosporus]